MKQRIFKVISILFLIIIGIIIYYLLIETQHFYIPCPFHKLTSFYCPGCGITRCLVELFELRFYASFRYNPLVFILLPGLAFYFVYTIYLYITAKEDKIISKVPKRLWYILIVIFIVYGILRNISFFSFLAPTSI